MKRSALILITICAAIACTKNNPEEKKDPAPVPTGRKIVLSLGKQTFSGKGGEALSVKWKNGDRIMVNGKSCLVNVVSEDSTTVTIDEADRYVIFYPAEICDEETVLVQPVQYRQASSIGLKASPATGSVNEGKIVLTPAFGVMRFSVCGTGGLASISLKDNAGHKICGSYKISSGQLVSTADIAYPEVCLNCKTNTNAAAELSASGTEFMVMLPAGQYASGFTFVLSGKDGRSATVTSTEACNVVAGAIADGPQLSYQPAEKQIFSFHFDNLSFGGDPVGGNKGFAVPNGSAVTGFDYSNIVALSTDPGSCLMASSTGMSTCVMPLSYLYSRGLKDFKSLYNVQEFHGYLGVGVNGQTRGVLKLPMMSNIPEGKVCKASITFRIAAQKNLFTKELGLLATYTSTGKVLEMWIDGTKVADCTPTRTVVPGCMGDDTRWASSEGNGGISPSLFGVERVLVKPSDLADNKWHTIKLVMGAVTPKTVIQFQPQFTNTTSAFFIDDVEAVYEDYDLPDASEILPFSFIMSPGSSTAMTRLQNQGPSLGITKYIDISLGTTFFSGRKWDDATIKAAVNTWVKNVTDAGYKVWNIHLPATDENGSYNEDIFEFFHYDKATRVAAVDRMKMILKWAKPFQSVNLMVHATGPGRSSSDSRYSFENAKDNGVASFAALVDYCNSDEMKYEDGSHPVFCIENIQNTGTKVTNVCALPEYMNYYCEKVPGLKVCFDASHAQVCGTGGVSAMDYLKGLGTNLGCLHMHGNGRITKDCHIQPGYKDGLGYDYGLNDIMDWGLMYKILLEDCKYTGPFTYEGGENYKDQVWSLPNLAHNYYGYILTSFKALK